MGDSNADDTILRDLFWNCLGPRFLWSQLEAHIIFMLFS